MPTDPTSPSGGDPPPRDPGRVPIEERWAPVSGRRPAGDAPRAFRTRWLAALVCLIVLGALLALAG